MTFAKDRLVYWDSFVGLLQIFKGNYFVMLEAAHELMRRVAIWAQEIGAIRATRHSALFGLAGGTQYCHALDGGHIQYIGENIVARKRRGALRTNGSLLMAYGAAYNRAHLGVPGLVHEQLVQAGLAEDMQAGEHPGRAQLAHAEGAALIAGLPVAARHLLQGIAGIAAVVVAADGIDVTPVAEYVAAVDLLGASGDDDAAVAAAAVTAATAAAHAAAVRHRRHRGGSGRNGHRGRCHPATMPSARDLQDGREEGGRRGMSSMSSDRTSRISHACGPVSDCRGVGGVGEGRGILCFPLATSIYFSASAPLPSSSHLRGLRVQSGMHEDARHREDSLILSRSARRSKHRTVDTLVRARNKTRRPRSPPQAGRAGWPLALGSLAGSDPRRARQ